MENATDIEAVRRQLLQSRYLNEIEFLKHTEYMREQHPERIEDLQLLCDNVVLIKHERKKTLTDHFDEVIKTVYKKDWTYIPPYHRIVKVQEYVSELVKDEKFCNKIMDELGRYLNESQLKSKKEVVYDKKKERVVEMPCLEVDLEKKTYKVKLF